MTEYNYKNKVFNIEYEFGCSQFKIIFNDWRPTDIIIQLPSNKYYSSSDLDLNSSSLKKTVNRSKLEFNLELELLRFFTKISKKAFFSDNDKYVVFGNVMTFNYIEGFIYLDQIKIGKSSTLKNAHILVKKYLQKQLENYITLTQKKFVQIMGYTFNPTIEIVQFKSFWGRYFTLKKHIQYSLELVKQTKEFIDIIIWHELTHVTCTKHDAKFYNTLLKYCPRYKQIKSNSSTIYI
ncbi:YgjP-like metallopeptidase domain-containing protein [Mycoplasma phocimorsus]|uniref:DUF45 domain-containing protein n=1 Tax=Mycoplasma phocimorsus TaxID=3045839 RepID=A0AAJ1PRX5_9MOLU|nr:YgjP-like metallopeptidase domain-containing protein [Mycoplasma phocimorsus]MDJ1645721.1 DUF45 domain-containing protein [Mycoplasma phocimorsus]MDJ1647797.1 DUF45 domain-containing protein [Mycoplasma phocimorsus]